MKNVLPMTILTVFLFSCNVQNQNQSNDLNIDDSRFNISSSSQLSVGLIGEFKELVIQQANNSVLDVSNFENQSIQITAQAKGLIDKPTGCMKSEIANDESDSFKVLFNNCININIRGDQISYSGEIRLTKKADFLEIVSDFSKIKFVILGKTSAYKFVRGIKITKLADGRNDVSFFHRSANSEGNAIRIKAKAVVSGVSIQGQGKLSSNPGIYTIEDLSGSNDAVVGDKNYKTTFSSSSIISDVTSKLFKGQIQVSDGINTFIVSSDLLPNSTNLSFNGVVVR